MNTVTLATEKSNTLFDPISGCISTHFKKQLDLVGIVSKQHFPEHDRDHIVNVNHELEAIGCFQRDLDFYKKGGLSSFRMSYAQAAAFLDDDYSDREIIMPREKRVANAIFPCGVEATTHKRFHSLHESLQQGYNYDFIHFIVKNNDGKEELERLINAQYQDLLSGIKFDITIADAEVNIFERGIRLLSQNASLGQEYVIITDPTFATKVEMIASSLLTDRVCMGIASAPIKDWKVDMNLYGYEAALGSHEKAAIAWASSAWNFKSRQVNTELSAYKAKSLQ